MKKPVKIILIVLAAVVVLYLMVFLTYPTMNYFEFYSLAEKAAPIPGMWEDFIPQGVTVTEDGTILICGYMPGDEPSRIYAIKDGSVKRVTAKKTDGSDYTGHAGGLTAAGDYIYISNASKLFVLRTADVLNAADGGAVSFLGAVEVPCRASYCSSDGEYVYVGEYHAPGYETADSHLVATAEGGSYQAMTFAYRLDGSAEFGVETKPSIAYATCDKAQGFAVNGSMAVVSCSSGLASSRLRLYNISGEPEGAFYQDGEELPLYILDSGRATMLVSAPHMSEDLEFRGDRLYVAFEAGAKKFGAGLLPASVTDIMKLDFNWK